MGRSRARALPSHLHVCHVRHCFGISASLPISDQARFRKDPTEINFQIILTLVGLKLDLKSNR